MKDPSRTNQELLEEVSVLNQRIQELKKLEAEHKRTGELKKSEALLFEMTNQVPGLVYQFYARPNGELGLYYVSDRSEQVVGLKPDLEGFFERFIALVIPEHRDGFIKSIEKAVKEASVWKYEGMLQKPSGEKIWFSGNSTPSPRENEMVFNGIIQDITDRKQAEYQAGKRIKELQAFFKLSELITRESITIEELLQEFIDLLPQSWQYPEITCTRIVIGEKEFRTKNFEKSEWMQSASIKVNREVVGGIEVYYLVESKEESEGPFLKEERMLIDAIAERLGHFAGTKRTEDALIESEVRYRTLFDNANDGLALADAETGQLVDCNQSLCRMVGRDKAELVGEVQTILHPPMAVGKKYSKSFEYHRNSDPADTMEDCLISKSGKLIPVEIRAARVRLNDRNFLAGIFRDITERKQAEARLRESEEKYRLMVENAHDVVFRITPGAILTYVSPAVTAFGGYDVQEVIGQHIEKYFADPFQFEQTLPIIARAIEKQQPQSVEFLYQPKDRTPFWVEVVGNPIFVNNQITEIYCIMRDISERKRAEERLKETLENLRKALGTTLQVMISVVETRDPYTAGHQIRVADLARTIATEMGLSKEKIENIRIASSIHDIGKLFIPAEILSKPAKLSEMEFALIKEHTYKGYEILLKAKVPWPLAETVYQHHERMDGSGYPRNLKGEEIIIEARVLAVADVVEAMASHRPCRPALGVEAALEEIEKNKETLYDATVVDACLKVFRENGYQFKEK
jgi:PAS domain S-box-containing protein